MKRDYKIPLIGIIFLDDKLEPFCSLSGGGYIPVNPGSGDDGFDDDSD